LVESFKSTLEEVARADLLLNIVDCGDPECEERIVQTRQVLAEIGADHIPYFLIYNKIDANPGFVPSPDGGAASFAISALHKTGLAAVRAELIALSQRHLGAPVTY
jgi:GTP-binding protein HflX